MVTLTCVFFALFGATLGSFGNVLIYRIAHGRGVTGRSACPHCQHVIAWYDLVPVLSFVALRARCRSCRKPISSLYPAVELSAAALFVLAYLLTTSQPMVAVTTATVFYGLLLIFVFDFRHQQIPDIFTAIVVLGAIASVALRGELSSGLLGAVLLFLWFGIQWAVSGGRFVGSGDIFLGLGLGLWLGFTRSVEMLFLSYIIGAAAALYLLATGRARLKDSQLPFGPFLACGALLTFTASMDRSLTVFVSVVVAVILGYTVALLPKVRIKK